MVPIFQYTNSYTVTPKLRQLAVDKKLQGDCLRYVAKSGYSLNIALKISFFIIWRLSNINGTHCLFRLKFF